MNLYPETICNTTNILLHGISYPIKHIGQGNIPALCIGIGTLLSRTLSDTFKQHFDLYSGDWYWIDSNALEDPQVLTIKRIVTDIATTAEQLSLSQYFIIAHSAFGLIALEAAKQFNNVVGVIMIGTPPVSNTELADYCEQYFKKHAKLDRQQNDEQRQKALHEKIKSGKQRSFVEQYIAASARYWADYQIPDVQLKALWQNCAADDSAMQHLFGDLLPNLDLGSDIEKLSTPVCLLGGNLDFDCLPLIAWDCFGHKPKNMTVVECQGAGHWPQIETSDSFDLGVVKWLHQLEPH